MKCDKWLAIAQAKELATFQLDFQYQFYCCLPVGEGRPQWIWDALNLVLSGR